MALPKVGVQLVLEDAGAFFSDLKRAQDGIADLGKANVSGAGFDAIGQAARGAAGDIKKTGDAARDSGGGFSALREVGIGALREIGAAAITAGAEIAKGIGAGIVDSVAVAGDFEAAVNNLAAVSGDALAEAGFGFDDVSAKALQLGQSTAFSASQSIAAMTELVKGGVPVAAVMDEATTATLNLAAAAGVDLSNAAEIVAKQYGVWADTGMDATQISDLLTQAANASTVGVEDLALGLANVGGVAKVSGLSFNELVETMALIAPGFSSAADAGTSLKTFLTSLNPATTPAKDAMADLGLWTKETGSAFYDAQGQFVGMEEAAALLQGALAGTSEEFQTATLKAIFGQDAFRAAALIAEAGAGGLLDMQEAMAGAGTAAEVAAIQNQGWNFVLDSLNGAIETLQITIGTLLLPILVPLAEKLGGLVSITSNVVSALAGSRMAFDLLPASVQGFLAPLLGMESALTSSSEAVRNAATPLLTLQNIFNELPAPMQAVVAFLRDNWQPVLAAAGGVLAVVLVPALASLAGAFAAAAIAAAPVVAIGAALGLAIYQIAPAFQSLYTILFDGNATLEAFTTLVRMFGVEGAQAIVRFGLDAKAAFDGLMTALAPVMDAVWQVVDSFFEAGAGSIEFNEALGYLQSSLADLGGQLLGWVQESMPGWIAGLSEMGAKLGSWVMEAIPPLIANLMDARLRLVSWVLDSLPTWAAELGKLAYALYNWVLAALPDLGTNLGKIAALLIEKTGEFIAVVVPKLLELGGKFIVWVATEVLPKLPGELVKVSGALLTGIGNFIKEVAPELIKLGAKFINWVQEEVLPKAPGELAKIGTAIVKGITDFIANVDAEAAKIGTAIADGIKSGFSSAWEGVKKWVADQVAKLPEPVRKALGIGSPSRLFAEAIGAPISQGIAVGIDDAAGATLGAVRRLADGVIGTAQPVVGRMLAIGQEGARAFGQGFSVAAEESLIPVADWHVAMGEAFGRATDDAFSSGESIAEGLAKGIQAGAGAAASAAEKLAAGVTSSAQTALDISSPSGIFAEEVGRPVVQGWAQGMLDNLGILIDAAAEISSAVLEEATAFASTIQDALGPILADAYQGAADFAGSQLTALDVFDDLLPDTKALDKLSDQIQKLNAKNNALIGAGVGGPELQAVREERARLIEEYGRLDRITAEQQAIARKAQADIIAAQKEALALSNPAERAAFLDQAIGGIEAIAKARQALAGATTDRERQIAAERLRLTEEQVKYQNLLYQQEARDRQAAQQQALRDAEDALKQLGNLVYFSQQDVFGAGQDAIRGLTRGMLAELDNLKAALGGELGDVLGYLKTLLGIASPSRLWAKELGAPMGEGVVAGARGALMGLGRAVAADLMGAASVAGATIRPALTGAQQAGGGSVSSSTISNWTYAPTYMGGAPPAEQNIATMQILATR